MSRDANPLLLATTGTLTLATTLTLAAPPPTPVTEVVMYTADGDTGHLLRFVFETNEFNDVGAIVNQAGEVMEDIESLAYIPSGPMTGFYGVSVAGGPNSSKHKLARINPVTADAYVFGIGGGSGPLSYTRGMTPQLFAPGVIGPADAGDWRLLAVKSHNDNTECYLNAIDPATGLFLPLSAGATSHGIAIVDGGGSFVQCEGVAVDANGELFVTDYDTTTKKSRVSHLGVDWAAGSALATPLTGYVMSDRIEALEFAYGDAGLDPAQLPWPASSWNVSAGLLIGFSDDDDTLVIVNAALGSGQEGAWMPLGTVEGEPIAFMSIDTEGIIFTTQLGDPNQPILSGFD